MLFSTVTFTEFDVSKKSDWLFADFCCLLDTWAAMVAASIVLSIIVYGITGIHPFVIVGLSDKRVISSIIVTTFVISFVLVFVLRYNFMVIGPRRQFRYICRWL